MSGASPFQVTEIRTIFDGRAAYVSLAGQQTSEQATARLEALMAWLMQREQRAFLFDLRDADYSHTTPERLLNRARDLAARLPDSRMVILHQGEDLETLELLLTACRDSGHDVIAVRQLRDARPHLCPDEDGGDIVEIDI